jgi:hypothetical protein
VGDFCAEGSVIHEEDVKVQRIVDNELLEPIGQEELGRIIRSITDFRHFLVTSESPSHAVIDT